MSSRPKYKTKTGQEKEVNIYYEIRQLRVVDGFELAMKHKVILFTLETHGENIFPSRNALARECCCAISTIDSAIKDLIKIGVVTKSRRRNQWNPKQFTSNLYTIDKERICEAVKVQQEFENNKFKNENPLESFQAC